MVRSGTKPNAQAIEVRLQIDVHVDVDVFLRAGRVCRSRRSRRSRRRGFLLFFPTVDDVVPHVFLRFARLPYLPT